MSKKVAWVVDAQNDFMQPNGILSIKGADKVIPEINNWLKSLTVDEYEMVVFTEDTHNKTDYAESPESKMFPIHCEKGTWGHELAVDMSNVDSRIPIWTAEKDVFDVWQKNNVWFTPKNVLADSVPRDFFINSLKSQEVKEIDVVGVASDFCVLWAVQGFVNRGFKVNIVSRKMVAGIERQIDQVVEEEFSDKDVTILE